MHVGEEEHHVSRSASFDIVLGTLSTFLFYLKIVVAILTDMTACVGAFFKFLRCFFNGLNSA